MIQKEQEESGGHMSKEIATGILIVGGAIMIVVGAEVAIPAVAFVGAGAALGAGVVQAISAPRNKRL